jgi:hypothetical protein
MGITSPFLVFVRIGSLASLDQRVLEIVRKANNSEGSLYL